MLERVKFRVRVTLGNMLIRVKISVCVSVSLGIS